MADVVIEANFQTEVTAGVHGDTVEDRVVEKMVEALGDPGTTLRARNVEERVLTKMVAAVIGPDASNFVRLRVEAEARSVYRMSLAMFTALADEGIVTYTGDIENK